MKQHHVDNLDTPEKIRLQLIQECSEVADAALRVIKQVTKHELFGEQAHDQATGISYDNVALLNSEILDVKRCIAMLEGNALLRHVGDGPPSQLSPHTLCVHTEDGELMSIASNIPQLIGLPIVHIDTSNSIENLPVVSTTRVVEPLEDTHVLRQYMKKFMH